LLLVLVCEVAMFFGVGAALIVRIVTRRIAAAVIRVRGSAIVGIIRSVSRIPIGAIGMKLRG
jgi:hypothetical protein